MLISIDNNKGVYFMSTQENNKMVVRRFIDEVLTTGKPDSIDQLLGPTYVNRLFDTNLDGFKQMFATIHTAFPDVEFKITDLIAEGDNVVAHFSASGTFTGTVMGARQPDGKCYTFKGNAYYRLMDGKIVEDDPVMEPNFAQIIGLMMPEKVKM
jgi:predicted ester cyclase